ncbi:MAG: Na+/H+ antiporter NhaA [Planctomycetes bacterium]|nr:Na+/H+ antiporter NhaA [Planctomycetota bacterium]
MKPERDAPLPREPIDRLTRPVADWMHVEASSGFVLLACTLAALGLANSPWAEGYLAFWKTKVGFQVGSFGMQHSLQHWINDGLMAVFFFVIGLEVKRELVHGELRDARRAALPIAAAIGGMVAPALLYLAFAGDGPARNGWGIPMATDIAFVVGCMAVLGRRVPVALRILLLSLAIADDIGAILVIAVGYTDDLDLVLLGAGFAGIVLVAVLARLGVRSFGVYTALGAAIWYGFHESGVHATIAGVILGLQTPARAYLGRSVLSRWVSCVGQDEPGPSAREAHAAVRVARETVSPLDYLVHALHPWVAFVIMPVFALANAGVSLAGASLFEPVPIAVAIGLILGKPLGIVVFSFVAVRTGLCRLPTGVSWTVLLGAGFLAGIGFTMALFIAGLALEGDLLDAAKVGILAGSAVSAALGMACLFRWLPTPPTSGRDSGGS